MLFKGFRFGMLLQLAVGPVCLFVFQTATSSGFLPAESAAAGVVIVDMLYIAAAVLGIAAFAGRKNVKIIMKYFGAVVLCLFGVATILAQFGIVLLPGLNPGAGGRGGAFLRALALTASNPLTILFWAGVFSAKVAELEMDKRGIWLFGLGAVLSTALFMSAVAGAGSLVQSFLPAIAITVLNVAVGAALIFFGVRMGIKKQP